MPETAQANVKTGIYESGSDTRELFRVEMAGGRYFAVRDANPRFAIDGPSVTSVAEQAVKALALKEKRNIIDRQEWDALLNEKRRLEAQLLRYSLPSQRGARQRTQDKIYEINRKIRAVDGVIGIDA